MADRDSGFGLQEMEPSPVEETPAGSNDAYFPATSPSSSKTSNTAAHLGLSQHSVLWYLSRIQRYSSYAFTAFGLAHMANTSLIPLVTRSVPSSESFLLLTRPYYQGLPFEALLVVAPVWAHVLSGLGMRVYRARLNAARFGDGDDDDGKGASFSDARFWPAVSGVAKLGFQLVPLLAGHVYVNRAVPHAFAGGSSNVNLGYVSHAFARHPAVSFVAFSALLVVACFHVTWGWARWLGYTPVQATAVGPERAVQKKRRWYLVNGVAAALTGLWMAGGLGVIGRGGAAAGWVGRQYDQMYRSIPLIGRWM